MTMTLPITKAGRRGDLVEHQFGALRHARHAHARLVHYAAGLRKPLAQHLDRARVIVDRHAERLSDRVGGDVVVGRADAAGGEDVSVAGAQRVERGDDLRLLVGNDADFLQIDADGGELFGDIADVLVLGAAGEDLVADDQKRGGDDLACPRCFACSAPCQLDSLEHTLARQPRPAS